MADAGLHSPKRLANIAPAPSATPSSGNGLPWHAPSRPQMPYSCQTCARRKVKCDKLRPSCSSCLRSRSDCVYQAPPPRRKRRAGEDLHSKLSRYERILNENGLLPQQDKQGIDRDTAIPRNPSESPRLSESGTLVKSGGKSRYVDVHPWRSIGPSVRRFSSDEEHSDVSDDDAIDGSAIGSPMITTDAREPEADPLTEAFVGSQRNLSSYHPTYGHAMIMWRHHVDNVEPLCKVIHVPSTQKLVEECAREGGVAEKPDECLLFAIYHFAVYSMTDAECSDELSASRSFLLRRYHFAARQALVNAGFLKTTELKVLQAFILFLLSSRYWYDPHTYWILTGVAFRIGQRMGLHRDGELLDLPPFDVQIRRRVFYQLFPLDGIASHSCGSAIPILPGTWDAKPPLNINDDQIWPEMTEPPNDRQGATEMMFCLARVTMGKFFMKAGLLTSLQEKPRHRQEIEELIREAETTIESRFIRYCDIADPLHFLTVGLARSAVDSMHLRLWLPKSRSDQITEEKRRELFELAVKILNVDTTTHNHLGLRRFMWHIRPLFAWGSWDAMIFVLTCLQGYRSAINVDAGWKRVSEIFQNHEEFLHSNRSLHVAVCRLTLQAWEAHKRATAQLEPEFITNLRHRRKRRLEKRAEKQGSTITPRVVTPSETAAVLPTPPLDTLPQREDLPSSATDDLMMGDGNLDTADWMFWDQLIRDYEAQQDAI